MSIDGCLTLIIGTVLLVVYIKSLIDENRRR